VPPDAPAAVYIAHLRSMADHSQDISARVERLITLVHERHSIAAHEAAMTLLAATMRQSTHELSVPPGAGDARKHMVHCS